MTIKNTLLLKIGYGWGKMNPCCIVKYFYIA